MANRYWVGGSGTWNTTSTTNWSTASGGASGASVPTAADSVFFDQAGTYTVTMTGALTCLDITVSAGTVTFATGTSPTLAISGSMSLIAGTVWSSTGNLTFTSTSTGRTITTNGVAIAPLAIITFNGVGGGWTLGSALTVPTSSLNFTAGTFDTSSSGNYSVTCDQFSSGVSNVRTINLNASTVTIGNGAAGAFNANTSTNLTFNAGTSQINFTSGTAGLSSVGLTFYNVSFTSTTAGTKTITGINTFNNLSVTAPSAVGVTTLTFNAAQTINGTLSTTGTAGNRRVFFASSTYGIAQTLTINGGESLTDADFRDIYVIGTASPATGTRIGNRGNCRGITFSTPKTVYWNLSGAQNWSANGWATTSTGTPSTDNFPLPQDSATFTNAGSVTGTITLDTAIGYCSNVDMSGRTSAMTLGTSNSTVVYGSWVNGSGTAFTGTATLTFSGGNTQTITSAGKTFSCPITIDTYGGTVQLADALNIGSQTLTVTNGTFNTLGYSVTASSLSSSNSNVRAINLGASTVTTSSGASFIDFSTATNLTFNSGTSTITNSNALSILNGGGQTFYNVSFNGGAGNYSNTINGANTFNNLSFVSPLAGIGTKVFSANQVINGTLTCAGAAANQRVFLQSDTLGTVRTLTVNSLSANDCDFRDITIAGTAAGSSPTRAGDCGGNTGITFPSPKTVYWNLAGAQNWSATGWATSSGGTPDTNNFPLAQDTAVFDNTGSVTGTITIDAVWNIGTFDASARTSAMTFSLGGVNVNVYGDWKWGTGVTNSNTTGAAQFFKPGTQTITSNGVTFNCSVSSYSRNGKIQLADALTLGATKTLTLYNGEFDAVTYNVTVGLFSNSSNNTTIRMGSGTWTLSGTGNVWNNVGTPAFFYKGTANIVLSDTSTSARTFAGAGLSYNKLTIGGTTGTSTLSITGANQFTEIASTKTVAHTINFQSSVTTTVGKWSVTGTVGNVVTLAPRTAATTYTLFIAGPANTGIDYLSISYCAVSTTSAGEFYVGANSTNTAGNTGPIFFTATPTPRTLYWVGGTGNWSSTTKWSTSSGGSSGAAVPTSLDAVVFNGGSNNTAYTATVDVIGRCASFTMSGPALSGNVTWAGTSQLSIHGDFTLAATGITRSYTGALQFASNTSRTITTNGQTLASAITINGVGATWTLAGAITTNSLTLTNGTFDTGNFAAAFTTISASVSNIVGLTLGSSTVTVTGAGGINFQSGTATTFPTDLTLNAGTSSIILNTNGTPIYGGNKTFYNVSQTNPSAGTISIYGANTFNNLSSTAPNLAGLKIIAFYADQTINGTLTLSAGTNATMRHFVQSDTIEATRTLTCAAFSGTDVDFRDITIAGAAAPVSGTRLADCKGNSGITFDAPKTVYWNLATGGNWTSTGWATTGGGTPAANNFPLAQDTAVFQSTGLNSGATVTINISCNIGTIDMSARTANTMTLALGSTVPRIYGNWINGTGTTISASSAVVVFLGRTTQTITSSGVTFSGNINISSPGGTVSLQDALSTGLITLARGTFQTNSFAVTASGFSSSTAGQRVISFGSSVLTFSSTTPWSVASISDISVSGTGTISCTSAATKTFSGGGISYAGVTLNQGGAGTLTLSGDNTFKTVTNTYSATGATTINLAATTTTLTNPWTAAGTSGKVLTVSGTSAASPATLVYTGAGIAANVDYLTVSNVRAYDPNNEWYAGNNSTNAGSLGWYFSISPATTYMGNFFVFF